MPRVRAVSSQSSTLPDGIPLPFAPAFPVTITVTEEWNSTAQPGYDLSAGDRVSVQPYGQWAAASVQLELAAVATRTGSRPDTGNIEFAATGVPQRLWERLHVSLHATCAVDTAASRRRCASASHLNQHGALRVDMHLEWQELTLLAEDASVSAPA